MGFGKLKTYCLCGTGEITSAPAHSPIDQLAFLVATGTETTGFAGECEKINVTAVVAVYAGEAFM